LALVPITAHIITSNIFANVKADNSITDIRPKEFNIGRINLTQKVIPLQLFPNPQQTPHEEFERYLNETYIFEEVKPSNETVLGPKPKSETSVDGPAESSPNFQILANHKVTLPSTPSVSNEPSVANKGQIVLYVGNWYVARSDDGGRNWKYIDPSHDMVDFCCDQDVIYDQNHGIFIWYRQGKQTPNMENIFRLGVSFDTSNWWFYNVRPMDLNRTWTNQSFDYPHLALGNQYLYISTNIVTESERSTPIILRLSLEDLRNIRNTEFSYYQEGSINSDTFTPVQGASNTMYWALHRSNNQIRLYQWNESLPSPDVEYIDKHIPAWSRLDKGEGDCSTFNGEDWCGRADDSISSGWLSDNVIGFFWNANEQTTYENGTTFDLPYIDAATFKITSNISNSTYLGRPYLWNPNFAWLYGYASPNEKGDVAVVAFYGGNELNRINMAAGIDDSFNGSPPRWEMRTILNGTHLPSENEWGDFVRLRPENGSGSRWVSSGFTLQGNNTERFIEARYIVFGLGVSNVVPSLLQSQPLLIFSIILPVAIFFIVYLHVLRHRHRKTKTFSIIFPTVTLSQALHDIIIIGTNFGEEKGRVFFGGRVLSDENEIVSWNNTQVKIKINELQEQSYKIRVITADNRATSTAKLQIKTE
jgi:hypothetical protein